jgi:hypothetical protein
MSNTFPNRCSPTFRTTIQVSDQYAGTGLLLTIDYRTPGARSYSERSFLGKLILQGSNGKVAVARNANLVLTLFLAVC